MTPRLIPLLTYSDGRLINTKKFEFDCTIGVLSQNIKSQNFQGADEICVLNIGKRSMGLSSYFSDLSASLVENFLPVCCGGSIRSFEDATRLFECGVEKIAINSLFFSEEGVNHVSKISYRYGIQAIVRVIDVERDGSGWVLRNYNQNTKKSYDSLGNLFNDLEYSSFGELLVQRVDLDGTMLGWETEFLAAVAQVPVPVIIAGGCGCYEDIYNAFKMGISGVAMASFLLLGDNNCHRIKAFLRSRGIYLRSS